MVDGRRWRRVSLPWRVTTSGERPTVAHVHRIGARAPPSFEVYSRVGGAGLLERVSARSLFAGTRRVAAPTYPPPTKKVAPNADSRWPVCGLARRGDLAMTRNT